MDKPTLSKLAAFLHSPFPLPPRSGTRPAALKPNCEAKSKVAVCEFHPEVEKLICTTKSIA